jgi:hypothetical protein
MHEWFVSAPVPREAFRLLNSARAALYSLLTALARCTHYSQRCTHYSQLLRAVLTTRSAVLTTHCSCALYSLLTALYSLLTALARCAPAPPCWYVWVCLTLSSPIPQCHPPPPQAIGPIRVGACRSRPGSILVGSSDAPSPNPIQSWDIPGPCAEPIISVCFGDERPSLPYVPAIVAAGRLIHYQSLPQRGQRVQSNR